MEGLSIDGKVTILSAVDRISHQRVTNRFHMDTNLVSPPCFQPTPDQRGPGKTLDHFKMGDSRFPVPVLHRHPLAVMGIPADGSIPVPQSWGIFPMTKAVYSRTTV